LPSAIRFSSHRHRRGGICIKKDGPASGACGTNEPEPEAPAGKQTGQSRRDGGMNPAGEAKRSATPRRMKRRVNVEGRVSVEPERGWHSKGPLYRNRAGVAAGPICEKPKPIWSRTMPCDSGARNAPCSPQMATAARRRPLLWRVRVWD